MLVLNRRIGQSVYLGDTVCVTVLTSQRDRIVIAVMAPSSIRVHSTDAAVCTAIHDATPLDGDERPHLFVMHSGQTLTIDDSEIRVTFTRSALSTLRQRPGCVQLAVRAPAHVAVHREEVYAQRQSDAERRPLPCSPAKRLQKAKVSIAHPSGAMPAWVAVGASAPADAEFVFA